MIKNLVFDFGGVVVDLCRAKAVSVFEELGVKNANELLDDCSQMGIFREVEEGKMDADTFCARLSEIAGRPLTYEETARGWLGFIDRVPQDRLERLQTFRSRYKVYILSNTNPFVMGWARSATFSPKGLPLDAYVDHIVASFECQSMKPDEGIFRTLIAETGLIPEESVFVDDGPANIATGKALGFHTLLATNGTDCFDALDQLLSQLEHA